MNCDQVFNVLTKCSFPSGATTDDCVESHLRTCYECRQMAEALRPALDLFHESLAPEDRCELPCYRGGHAGTQTLPAQVDALIEKTLLEPAREPWRVPAKEETAREETAKQETAPQEILPLEGKKEPNKISAVWRGMRRSRSEAFVISSLVSVAVCLLFFSLTTPTPTRMRAQDSSRAMASAPLLPIPLASVEPSIVAHINRLRLPEACLTEKKESSLAGVACCTNCHAAGSTESPPLMSLAAAWDTCNLCHTAMAECF